MHPSLHSGREVLDRHGEGRRELDCPISITIDISDRVYVGDCNHCISVFTSECRFLTSFGRDQESLIIPRELAVDVNGVGVVYVCEHDNNRI